VTGISAEGPTVVPEESRCDQRRAGQAKTGRLPGASMSCQRGASKTGETRDAGTQRTVLPT
jgi:hypothetical protein